MEGEILSGGNLNSVIRIGDTVRRRQGEWSAAVHQLLLHLEEKEFEGAPRFLGIDAGGREVLSFITGEVGFMPYIWSNDSLVEAARLLRRFHDATEKFVKRTPNHWQWSHPDTKHHEVICHGDFAPYNLVFRDQKPCALIDFNFAGPGPRLWDLALAVYWFAPLAFGSDLAKRSQSDLDTKSRRLHQFCSVYGVEANSDLLDTIDTRLGFLCQLIQDRSELGEAAWIKMCEDGHLAHWEREHTAFKTQRRSIERNL